MQKKSHDSGRAPNPPKQSDDSTSGLEWYFCLGAPWAILSLCHRVKSPTVSVDYAVAYLNCSSMDEERKKRGEDGPSVTFSLKFDFWVLSVFQNVIRFCMATFEFCTISSKMLCNSPARYQSVEPREGRTLTFRLPNMISVLKIMF